MLISEDSANVAKRVCATVSRIKLSETVMELGTCCGVDASLVDDFGSRRVSSVLLNCLNGERYEAASRGLGTIVMCERLRVNSTIEPLA